eukprot:4247358-Lingulodinium_polyedra.AAC.1
MRPTAFNELVNSGVVKHVLLRQNAVMRVPFGYGWATVAMDTGVTGTFFIPYLSTVIAHHCAARVIEA